MDAAKVLDEFYRGHGLDPGPGVIASVLAADQHTPLAERIADSAPAHLAVLAPDGSSLALLPMPIVGVGADGALVLIRRAGARWLEITRGAGAERVANARLAEQFNLVAVVCAASTMREGFDLRRFVAGFARANSRRLRAGFLGTLYANLAALAMPIGALLIIDKVLSQHGVGTLSTLR